MVPSINNGHLHPPTGCFFLDPDTPPFTPPVIPSRPLSNGFHKPILAASSSTDTSTTIRTQKAAERAEIAPRGSPEDLFDIFLYHLRSTHRGSQILAIDLWNIYRHNEFKQFIENKDSKSLLEEIKALILSVTSNDIEDASFPITQEFAIQVLSHLSSLQPTPQEFKTIHKNLSPYLSIKDCIQTMIADTPQIKNHQNGDADFFSILQEINVTDPADLKKWNAFFQSAQHTSNPDLYISASKSFLTQLSTNDTFGQQVLEAQDTFCLLLRKMQIIAPHALVPLLGLVISKATEEENVAQLSKEVLSLLYALLTKVLQVKQIDKVRFLRAAFAIRVQLFLKQHPYQFSKNDQTILNGCFQSLQTARLEIEILFLNMHINAQKEVPYLKDIALTCLKTVARIQTLRIPQSSSSASQENPEDLMDELLRWITWHNLEKLKLNTFQACVVLKTLATTDSPACLKKVLILLSETPNDRPLKKQEIILSNKVCQKLIPTASSDSLRLMISLLKQCGTHQDSLQLRFRVLSQLIRIAASEYTYDPENKKAHLYACLVLVSTNILETTKQNQQQLIQEVFRAFQRVIQHFKTTDDINKLVQIISCFPIGICRTHKMLEHLIQLLHNACEVRPPDDPLWPFFLEFCNTHLFSALISATFQTSTLLKLAPLISIYPKNISLLIQHFPFGRAIPSGTWKYSDAALHVETMCRDYDNVHLAFRMVYYFLDHNKHQETLLLIDILLKHAAPQTKTDLSNYLHQFNSFIMEYFRQFPKNDQLPKPFLSILSMIQIFCRWTYYPTLNAQTRKAHLQSLLLILKNNRSPIIIKYGEKLKTQMRIHNANQAIKYLESLIEQIARKKAPFTVHFSIKFSKEIDRFTEIVRPPAQQKEPQVPMNDDDWDRVFNLICNYVNLGFASNFEILNHEHAMLRMMNLLKAIVHNSHRFNRDFNIHFKNLMQHLPHLIPQYSSEKQLEIKQDLNQLIEQIKNETFKTLFIEELRSYLPDYL